VAVTRVAPASVSGPPFWPRWRRLPRDARDTLFLLGVIAWTVLPHLAHLPLWCAMLTGAVLLWRSRLALTQAALPGRWVLVATLMLAAGLTLWTHRTLLGKEAGVTMLVVLMALKTLELRARRDAFVVFFLGFFLVLTHFLYSQSLLVALAMLVSVWGLLTALVLAHMPVGQPALRQAAGLAARCASLGAPLMVLLFLLFPRIGPLWGVPSDGLARTGLSEAMQMGTVAALASDDSVALRLRFKAGQEPSPEALYFRGPVLSRFDGREWRPAATRVDRGQPAPEVRPRGPALPYEMTLEPSRMTILPLLEAASAAPRLDGYRTRQSPDLDWRIDRPLSERLRFEASANLVFEQGPLLPVPALAAELELPDGANPRTLAWAARLRGEAGLKDASPGQIAAAVMQHIRRDGYVYTLTPGLYAEEGGLDAIDEFWLDRKQGFCEHYAAAFVVVMRAMGVPARIVTGYQGADALPVDGYLIVRQSNAHAWAEYWERGRGWVRADPTAAIAPDRIRRSQRLRPAPGLVESTLGGMSPALLARLRTGWEALNNRWNQWVLTYSRGQQFDLLRDIGFSAPSWEDLALLLIGALSTLSLAGAAWAWWERRHQDPWARQATQLRHALQALGLTASPWQGPRTLATQVRARFGAAGEALAALLIRLDQQRYGRTAGHRPDAGLTRAARREARQLARGAARQSTT
jgi:protein-glutamine gamma-glutamyltransferase